MATVVHELPKVTSQHLTKRSLVQLVLGDAGALCDGARGVDQVAIKLDGHGTTCRTPVRQTRRAERRATLWRSGHLSPTRGRRPVPNDVPNHRHP